MTLAEIAKALGPSVKPELLTNTMTRNAKSGLFIKQGQRWGIGTGEVPAKPATLARSRSKAPTGPMSLANATLKCVANGYSTAADILDELATNYGMTVRANHLGIALQRHRKAGRLTEHNKVWSTTPVGQEELQKLAA